MRADRLLSILLLLQVQRRITARELAKRLEVSERTIYRDMEALGIAGVPVTAERGTNGGWALLRPYSTDLTGLNEAEIQALFLSRPSRLLDDLGLHQAAEGALIKLHAALPDIRRRDAEYARQRLHIDSAGWQRSEETFPHLTALQEAVWQERKVMLTYQRADETTVERLVDPLGLVAKGSVWYLVAAVAGEVRTYRVSRVRGTVVTEQPCVRPPGFDLAAQWEQSAAQFQASIPRFPIALRADPAIVAYMRYAARYARVERVDPPAADGWVRVAMTFEEEHNACEFVLSLGPRVAVVAPESLRALVTQAAAGIVALYAQDGHPADG